MADAPGWAQERWGHLPALASSLLSPARRGAADAALGGDALGGLCWMRRLPWRGRDSSVSGRGRSGRHTRRWYLAAHRGAGGPDPLPRNGVAGSSFRRGSGSVRARCRPRSLQRHACSPGARSPGADSPLSLAQRQLLRWVRRRGRGGTCGGRRHLRLPRAEATLSQRLGRWSERSLADWDLAATAHRDDRAVGAGAGLLRRSQWSGDWLGDTRPALRGHPDTAGLLGGWAPGDGHWPGGGPLEQQLGSLWLHASRSGRSAPQWSARLSQQVIDDARTSSRGRRPRACDGSDRKHAAARAVAPRWTEPGRFPLADVLEPPGSVRRRRGC